MLTLTFGSLGGSDKVISYCQGPNYYEGRSVFMKEALFYDTNFVMNLIFIKMSNNTIGKPIYIKNIELQKKSLEKPSVLCLLL